MWLLQPVVLPLPFVFESHSVTYEDLSARAMWPAIPFDQRAYHAVNEINGKLYRAQKSQVGLVISEGGLNGRILFMLVYTVFYSLWLVPVFYSRLIHNGPLYPVTLFRKSWVYQFFLHAWSFLNKKYRSALDFW